MFVDRLPYLAPSLALAVLLASCSSGMHDVPLEECPGDEVGVTVGIRYSHAPAGALEVTGPVPLAVGTSYTVVVYRSPERVQAGVATFRP
jgi:hypothetical protein